MKISGKVDQFGCGMIKEVSAKLPGEFVNCLQNKLAAPAAPAAVAAGGAPEQDLVRVAGGSISRRLVPVAVVLVTVVAVVVYFVVT